MFLEVEMQEVIACNVFRGLKPQEWCSLYLRRPNDSRKGMRDAFRGYKLTTKACLMYLEVKLTQGSCGWYN